MRPLFDPAVTVSALALHNLHKIPYSRFALPSHPDPPPSPVAERARWIESGVPASIAIPAAALSLLAEHVPSALCACLSLKSKNAPGPQPCLYVFGTNATQLAAAQLLRPAFVHEHSGVWEPHSGPAMILVTRALLSSVHRAINHALEAMGAVRIASTLVLPQANLSYTFAVSLGRGANPHVLIRVAVKPCNLRRITDHDTAAALHSTIHVQAGPTAVSGLLSPRPVAGDSLTASVIARWKEAGLLPSTQLPDSTVLFVTVSGVDVPFPRMTVLTTHPVKSLSQSSPSNTQPDKALHPKKPISAASLWKSRKRPRSPVSVDLPTTTPRKPSAVPLDPQSAQPAANSFASDAPTAQSLNAAIQAQGGLNHPVPVLHHPFVNPQVTVFTGTSTQSATQETDVKSQTAWDPASTTVKQQQTLQPISPVKPEPVLSLPTQPTQQSQNAQQQGQQPPQQSTDDGNAIDCFLQDSDSNAQDGFDTGPGMDMGDFCAIEDEFTEYFNDGMDDRIQNGNNDLLQDEDSQNGVSNQPKLNSVAKNASSAGTQPQDAANLDSSMEIDSESKPTISNNAAAAGNIGSASNLNPSPLDVVNLALDALRKPIPSTRPQKEAVRSQLFSFFEKDLSERRHRNLSANRTITKRRPRSTSTGKYSTTQLVDDYLQSTFKSANPTAAPEAITTAVTGILTPKLRSNLLQQDSRPTYVPRRKMKAYRKLRRAGLQVLVSSLVNDGTDSDSSVSDDEEGTTYALGNNPERSPATGGFLPAHLTASSPLKDINKPITDTNLSEALPRPSTDPRKIAESVAVDCASACMVLAVDKNCDGPGAWPADDRSGGSSQNQEPACSPTGIRDEDIKATPNASVSGHAVGKPILQHSVPKSQVSGVMSSPPSRLSSKQSRDFFAILSLLEMQMFSMPELSVFADGERIDSPEVMLKKQKITHEKESRQVSSAIMRRVLLGLPRALETSSVFGSCFASFQEENAETVLPTVQGPLSVNEFLGGDATVFPLESPRVCVGYNKEWMEASSGVLPLWEKSGFEPYSEKKNVEYVAVAPKDIEEDVRLFLRDISAAYEECLFGKHEGMLNESVTFISNSQAKSANSDKHAKSPTQLSDVDRSMAEQYHLAVTGLCTKLTAVTRDYRKNPSRAPANIVAYIVSPFPKCSTAANVSLMKAVAPLVTAIPGTVPSFAVSNTHVPNLPAAPWRSSTSSKGIISVTVRVIPREVVDRKLSGRTEVDELLKRPMRPQLMKAVSFAVFNSIRFKRVRNPSMDGEIYSVLSKASLMPDDLMSPMTPDIIAESPGGNTPVSPVGPSAEETNGQLGPGASLGGSLTDQSSALSPSFLHEPVMVLAGVGKHMGQTGERSNIVLHLAYAYCASSLRYVFVWTDQRGEVLDTATVPVSKASLTTSRRKAFWGMWARGQRWRISYVEEVHATVAKLGSMSDAEIEDWEWVIRKVTSARSGNAEKKMEESGPTIERRFPPLPPQQTDDTLEPFTDVSTPATPGTSQPMTSAAGAKNQVSMDIKMPTMSSVTLLSVCNADTHLFMEKSGDDNSDRRDFAVISDTSLAKERNVQANATLARFDDDGISAIEVNVLRHFGKLEEGEEMSDDRSPWDGNDIQAIANTIAVNFHELRYVSSPPSWPHKRWLSMYPIHLDAVRGFQTNLKHILSCPVSSSSSAAR